jgi:hypothetical protein
MSPELSPENHTKRLCKINKEPAKDYKKTTHMKNVIELFEMEYLKLTNYSVDLIWPCTTYNILDAFQFNCKPPIDTQDFRKEGHWSGWYTFE